MGMMINRRRACSGKKDLLPSGYRQLEYIENTSNAYINLGYISPNNLDIKIKFEYRGDSPGSGFTLGGRDGAFPTGFMFVGDAVTNGRLRIDYGGTGVATDTYQKGDIATIENDGKYFTIVKNGVTKIYTLGNVPQNNIYFLLFSIWRNNSMPIGGTHLARLFYFQAFQNGEPLFNLFPCKNPNNVVGMYDTVEGEFYSSPNGTAFIAGPEI